MRERGQRISELHLKISKAQTPRGCMMCDESDGSKNRRILLARTYVQDVDGNAGRLPVEEKRVGFDVI